MMATQQAPTRQRRLSEPTPHFDVALQGSESKRPIVAAIEPRTVGVTAHTAVSLARELGAPLVFIYVRARPPAILGAPFYQRRLTKDLVRGRKTLDAALAAASRQSVSAYGEILEGNAATRIFEFARARNARVLVVGKRRRRLRPSVSRHESRALGSRSPRRRRARKMKTRASSSAVLDS